MTAPSSPAVLHTLVHRGTLARRVDEDWWGSALETALAAVGAVRHPPVHRDQAQDALARLRRWWAEGQPRRLSADVVAVALTAKACAELARRDDVLLRDAVERISDLADRSDDIVPELHIALCSWALDALVPDRQLPPWPALRKRAARGRSYGFDATLSAYTSVVAGDGGPQRLVEALLAGPTASPGAADTSAVLWLITVGIERASYALSPDEPGLRALIDRRGQLVARLAAELDQSSFDEPSVREFDPDGQPELAPTMYLSSMDALLLDLALASPEPEDPYLTVTEARHLFGRREAVARADERRWIARAAGVLAVAGGWMGATFCLALLLAGAAAGTAVWAGLALAALPVLPATALWRRAGQRTLATPAAGLAATFVVFGTLLAINDAVTRPFLPDPLGVAAGAVGVALAALLVALSLRAGHSERDPGTEHSGQSL